MKRWMGLTAALAVTVMGAAAGAIGGADPNFNGLGSGFSGPAGSMTVATATPDPSLAVGPNHVVEAAGTELAVFSRSGDPLAGPKPVISLWAGWDSACATRNDGTTTVVYDRGADRWIVAHVASALSCVAVSETPDPAGLYTHYAFPLPALPVSNTLTAWPNAYIGVFERGAGPAAGAGTTVCAYDRSQMLAGLSATQQCFDVDATGVLPADLDGGAPPAGTPVFLLSLGSSGANLDLRMLRVDWATPANSSLTDPLSLPVQSWADPAAASIPQNGATFLESGAGRLMRRVAYRRFDDGHASIVANHTVATGSGAGVRWYEVQIPSDVDAIPSLAQQGTFAPDADDRWMGSIGIDGAGNIALGYNASSATIAPAIRYTGRLAGDQPGEMTQGEGTIITGGGAQTTAAWGRFSAMAQDPDGCRFWVAGEYLAEDGTLNWHTRVASFTLPECATPAANDFALTADPSSLAVSQAAIASTTIGATLVSGAVETIDLSVTGLPAGAFVTLAPASISTGGSSILTVSGGTAAPGSYALLVTGTSPSAQHALSIALTILAAPDFSISVAPASQTVAPGGSASYTVTTGALNGSTQSIALSVSGLPAGISSAFTPATVTAGGSATLTLTTTNATPLATTPFTVTGTAAPTIHTAGASLTVGFSVPVAVLASGVPVTGLSGTSTSAKYFVLNVPEGQDSLVFTINGGTPDVDLYVRYGGLPTTSTWDCRPFTTTNAESCTFSAPQAGNWFVMLRGYTSYSGVTLTGTYTSDSTPVLTNGVPVTGISGSQGSQQFWKMTVPAGQTNLTFKISGGSGDADLYVRNGSKPTTTAYNCRPYLTGTNETCTFTNPAAGVWYVMLRGYTAYSGVTLVGTYTGDTTTTALTNNVPVTGISGTAGSQQFWKLTVPAGKPRVTFSISGGSGDADLYVRIGSRPTTTAYSCRPYLNGNNETCTFNNPAAGDYYVMIRAYTTFSGVTLKGSY